MPALEVLCEAWAFPVPSSLDMSPSIFSSLDICPRVVALGGHGGSPFSGFSFMLHCFWVLHNVGVGTDDVRGPGVWGTKPFSVFAPPVLFLWEGSGVWGGAPFDISTVPVFPLWVGPVPSFVHAENLRNVAGLSSFNVCSFSTAHFCCVLVRAWLRAISESSSFGERGVRSSIICPLWVWRSTLIDTSRGSTVSCCGVWA